MTPTTPIFFWFLCNRPGAVWVGTQETWDWWLSEEGGACEQPHLLHEGVLCNFAGRAVEWHQWWPRDEEGSWPVAHTCRDLAQVLGCPTPSVSGRAP